MDRDIPQEHAGQLRRLCGLGEEQAIPSKLEAKYWELQRLSSRISSQTTLGELKVLCFTLGFGKPLDREENPTVVDLWRQGKLKAETSVKVMWREKRHDAVLKGIDSQGVCTVQIKDDTTERRLTHQFVSVA